MMNKKLKRPELSRLKDQLAHKTSKQRPINIHNIHVTLNEQWDHAKAMKKMQILQTMKIFRDTTSNMNETEMLVVL